MAKSVYCLADSETQAVAIIDTLRTAGFSNNDISVLFPDRGTSRDFAHEKNTKAPEGATAGASAGGILGGAIGWLAGVGALSIPGLGPFIAAGPVMAAFSGAAMGAAVGGLTGALVGLGVPEFEAKRYEGKILSGNILVSVHAEDGEQRRRITQIFETAGAGDIAATEEARV